MSEKFTVSGSKLVDKVRELVKDSSVKHIRIVHEGKVVFDIPLIAGAAVAAAGVIWLPVLAAIGALGAMVNSVTIEIDKTPVTEEKPKTIKKRK